MSRILDFDFDDVMRLSSVKRWAIVEMSREQSVAEHSYNVAMIVMMLVNEMENEEDVEVPELFTSLFWSLVHDLPELLTGDIPTPAKKHMDLHKLDQENFPIYWEVKRRTMVTLTATIVKAADCIDALQFAKKFCVDSRREEIIKDIEDNLYAMLDKKGDVRVSQAVDRLLA